MHTLGLSSFIAALTFGAGALAQSSIAEKVAQLRLAPSAVDRIKLLEDKDYVFDFLHPAGGESNGAGGHSVAASSSTFPAVIGNGMAMTIGFLGPCGFNTPHTHPRATEFNYAVNGTLTAGMLSENGARFVFNEVPPGSATIFPKGAIHFEMNNGCEDMIFVAAFNDEDPGVDQIAQRFYGLPPAFVAATLGEIGVEEVAGLEAKIPNNIALGTDECLQRCGLKRTDQPTGQRQPRIAANALPPGFVGPSPAQPTPTDTEDHTWSPTGTPSSNATPSSSTNLNHRSTFATSPTSQSVQGALSLNDADGKPNPLIISLIVVVAVLAFGYVVLAVVYFLRSRRERQQRTRGAKYFQTGSKFAPQGFEEKAPFESYDSGSHLGSRSTPYDPPAGH